MSGNANSGRGGKKQPAVNFVQQLTRERFIALSNELMHKSIFELRAVVADETNESLKVVVARILLAAMLDGDSKKLNDLLDRSIGRVIEKYEVVTKDSAENKDDFTPEELAQIAVGVSPIEVLKARLAQAIVEDKQKRKKK